VVDGPLADDVEWTEMAGFPLAGTYQTPEGVTANVMEKLGAEWEGWAAHDDTYVANGENVVVLARYTAINKATGKNINARVAHHFVVRAGTGDHLGQLRRIVVSEHDPHRDPRPGQTLARKLDPALEHLANARGEQRLERLRVA